MWAWVSELLDNAGNFEMINIGAFFNELCNWASDLMM